MGVFVEYWCNNQSDQWLSVLQWGLIYKKFKNSEQFMLDKEKKPWLSHSEK